MEFGQTYAPLIEFGFGPLAATFCHLERNSTLATSSSLVLRGKTLKVGVAGSMVTWRFVTAHRYWEFIKSPTDGMSVGRPTSEMVGYFKGS